MKMVSQDLDKSGVTKCQEVPQNHSQRVSNSKTFWGSMPPDPPRMLWPLATVNMIPLPVSENPSYAPV